MLVTSCKFDVARRVFSQLFFFLQRIKMKNVCPPVETNVVLVLTGVSCTKLFVSVVCDLVGLNS